MDYFVKPFPFACSLSLEPLLLHLEGATGPLGNPVFCRNQALWRELAQTPEFRRPLSGPEELEPLGEQVQALMSAVFPPVSWESEAVAAMQPFSMKPFMASPQFKRLFMGPDGFGAVRRKLSQTEMETGRLIRAYLHLLHLVYGIDKSLDYPLVCLVTDEATGLDRHYRFSPDLRFVAVETVGRPPEMTEDLRGRVLMNLDQPQELMNLLPPEHFRFSGFVVMRTVDVTQSEMISALGWDLTDQSSVVSQEGFRRIQDRLRTLFRRPELTASLVAIQKEQVLMLNMGCDLAHSCIFADSRHVPMAEFEGTIYGRITQGSQIIQVPDVLQDPGLRRFEKEFTIHGVRSCLIAPLEYRGKTIGCLEIASPQPEDLGPMEAIVLSQIQPLFAMALKKALDDLENQVQSIIKEKCTAIHPSVEWRFHQAAVHHLEELNRGRASEMEPIIFKKVLPFYGSSDIRGSSDERNRAVTTDLQEHLDLGMEVLRAASGGGLLIVEELALRVGELKQRLQAGLASGDELGLVQFMRQEVEPVFDHLAGTDAGAAQAVDAYRRAIDPSLGTVYRQRKQFEQSVAELNARLAAYLDGEDARLQRSVPHYFERHRTDGIDYIIYAGQPLLESGTFEPLLLKNMRLWQMMTACGVAWHTADVRAAMQLPLETAHLILVQDAPLTIRFRYDEKRFDIDGAYDIRHEILRSRVDKAVVAGSGQRLTQPGYLAVVYSQSGEEKELLRHLEFMRSSGYVTDEPEHLELEDLPGVQGLRALRVRVNLESKTLAKRAVQALEYGSSMAGYGSGVSESLRSV